MHRFLTFVVIAFCLLRPAVGQDIVLGNTLPFSGPLASAGQAARTGMEAYLARVDREGCVGGRHGTLRSMDDAYQADRHV
ncbi:MAG TPA: hypothetical protein VFL86_23670, partial [Burkholderiaceae bacterium]|nr:hypothetical protein [Burkholderiaceae bacterium]